MLKLNVRSWGGHLPLMEDLKKVPNLQVKVKRAPIWFFEGGILLYITIISVAANIVTIADILSKHLKKEKKDSSKQRDPAIRFIIADKIVVLNDLSHEKMVLLFNEVYKSKSETLFIEEYRDKYESDN